MSGPGNTFILKVKIKCFIPYRKIDRIESDGKDTVINPAEAEYMLHRLTHKEMLTGTEKVGGFKDSMFIDFLNGKNQDKISGRIKLINSGKKEVIFILKKELKETSKTLIKNKREPV